MAQFQVPQFIETEDKIIGPLTLKQFAYVGIAGLLAFALFFFLKTIIWLFIVIIMGTVASIFAFIKYNGRPLSVVLISAISYLWKPRFFIWKKAEPTMATGLLEAKQLEAEQMFSKATAPKTTEGETESTIPRLKSLWVKLHTSVPSPKEVQQQKVAIHQIFKGRESRPAFEILRKMTGERQAARRVDFR